MSNSNASNTSNTGTASASAPPRPLRRPDESESAFLARQAREAQDAMKVALNQLKTDLKQGVDPRLWTKQYPYASVGVAAAAGLAAALLLIPSREERALKRLEAIERALMPERYRDHNPHAPHPDDDGKDAYAKGHTSFLGGLGRQLLDAVKPAVLSALTAGITAHTAKTSPEEVAAATGAARGSGYVPGQPDPWAPAGVQAGAAQAGAGPGTYRPQPREDREGGPPDPSAAI